MIRTQASRTGPAPARRAAAGQSAAAATATHSTPTTVARATAVGLAAKQRPQEAMRAGWSATAMTPQLRGRRAAAWLSVWDSTSTARRVCMLETLKALHSASNSNALEEDLGDAAPLLFTRITSWWKLRYSAWVASSVTAVAAASAKAATAAAAAAAAAASATASEAAGPALVSSGTVLTSSTAAGSAAAAAAAGEPTLSLSADVPAASSPCLAPTPTSSSELLAQVEAITLFVRGSRYLLQFVESGGAATLTHCLEATSPSSTAASTLNLFVLERRATALLLLYVANAGRVYREMVGDEEGLLHVLRTLQRETDATVAAPLTELLAVLGQGHPRLASGTQTGLLRVLANAVQPAPGHVTFRAGSSATVSAPCSSEVVVLHTARAIRALQLQKEQHHYAQVGPGGSGSGGAVAAMESGIDYVPIVGMDAAVNAYSFVGPAASVTVSPSCGTATAAAAGCDPLLRPLSRAEYLDALFRLALDDEHMSFRVEGSELLGLAAKNLHLTHDILTRCLDAVDDDEYVIRGNEEEEDAAAQQQRLRRQRRQLSCGRTAVLLFLSRPMTTQRRQLLLRLVSQRSGHLTLLKHLRLTAHGDTAAVVDCCHALQFVVRSAADMQRHTMDVGGVSGHKAASRSGGGVGGAGTSAAVWLRVTEGVQAALGQSVIQLLLFQDLSQADCMAVLRAARAAVVPQFEGSGAGGR
ncbi:hypothetical protein NESM_000094300 [Novymonas esmeraldas]|uniref:Uncharacterized protein n=1 Tax=Novymonas esmeraldas TaxID=1808958 RepID=A0AAW0F1G5_9TRYP